VKQLHGFTKYRDLKSAGKNLHSAGRRTENAKNDGVTDRT